MTFEQFIAKCKQNENINAHTDNTLFIAKLVGTDDQIARANTIFYQQSQVGYLTEDMSQKQNVLNRELNVRVKAHFKLA